MTSFHHQPEAQHPKSSTIHNNAGRLPHLLTRAARMSFGAISLSIASHLPVMLSSYCNRPVRLPSGRDRLATKPEPIGSATPAKTIGIVLVSSCMAAVAGVDAVMITSGCSATSSLASKRA